LYDVAFLLHHFTKVSRAEQVGLVLSADPNSRYPEFHAHSRTVRMVCSYVGPGTLWMPPAQESRNLTPEALANSANRLSTGAVAVLKGLGYSGDTAACLHRNPGKEVGDARSIFLRLDVV
jgi:Protein of unknown function (DUF1826)